MTNLQEVPTEELLSFHDYPVVHQNLSASASSEQAQINITINEDNFDELNSQTTEDHLERDVGGSQNKSFSIWSLDYYQKFFDVDTKDVTDRIIASMTPKVDPKLRHKITEKPDLYGPFWVCTTLIFTIAISGNISDYLQKADTNYQWRYNFKLVSYAATAIWIYVLVLPITLWGILKWSSETISFNEEQSKLSGPLELICTYGYSLFIYIPVSVLWSIQISSLQWFLALFSASLSGSVLLLTLLPSLRASKHKMFLIISIISCHLLLAAGFMLYFFHTPDNNIVVHSVMSNVTSNTTEVIKDMKLMPGKI
ncbi:hypothetical protein WA026_009471 [Henosepilachna vigintioctopunctata]|uniref:Protein YIPF n=1 Tax=Henosepilachna vigintioctopunctata TaxID=420089 RepID=A0AAW1U6B5_9CUCU